MTDTLQASSHPEASRWRGLHAVLVTLTGLALALSSPADAQGWRTPGCRTEPDTLPEPITFEHVPFGMSSESVRKELTLRGFHYAGEFGPFRSLRFRGQWLGRPVVLEALFGPEPDANGILPRRVRDSHEEWVRSSVSNMLFIRFAVPADSVTPVFLALQDSLATRYGLPERPMRLVTADEPEEPRPYPTATGWSRLGLGMIGITTDSMARGPITVTYSVPPGAERPLRNAAREEWRSWRRRCALIGRPGGDY